jgi:hypothetical protein
VSQAFEWVAYDIRKLRDFVEGRTLDDAVDGRGGPDRDDFGVLRESPTLGDGKYKLEIGMKQAVLFLFFELKRVYYQRGRRSTQRRQILIHFPST